MRRGVFIGLGSEVILRTLLVAGISAVCSNFASSATSTLYAYRVTVPSVVDGGVTGVQIQSVIFDGQFIWVGAQDHNSGFVRKLNLSGSVVATAQVGVGPLEMAYDGSKLWVADYVSSDITIVSAKGAVVKTIAVPGMMPEGILYDGKFVWIANNGAYANTISKFDAASMKHLADYVVGADPDGFAYDGTYLWVTNSNSNNVMKLNRDTGQILRTYATGQFPLSVLFDGNSMWVGNGAPTNGSLTKLRAVGGVNLGTVGTGNGVRGLAYDGTSVWVCNSLDNTFSIVRASDGVVTGTYAAGKAPRAIAFDGAKMWIANSEEGALTVVTRSPGSQHGLVALQDVAPPILESAAQTRRSPVILAQLTAMLSLLLSDD